MDTAKPPRRTLIVCRDQSSLKELARFKPLSSNQYVLASDDPRVHEAAKGFSWIDEICWIEKIESFYSVAQEVLSLTEIVNRWLEGLSDERNGFPAELLFFTRVVEGGMTTQRIQDTLLLVRSYSELFDNHQVEKVILLSHCSRYWEDEVLAKVALAKGISVQRRRSLGRIFSKEEIKASLKRFMYEPYYFLNYLLIRQFFLKRNKNSAQYDILFQLCSSSQKHIENIVHLMRSLKDRSYRTAALCSGKAGISKAARKVGLQAEDIEDYLSLGDWFDSIRRLAYTLLKARRLKKNFVLEGRLAYQSVLLGPLLWESVIYFLLTESAKRYRLLKASQIYFSKKKVSAIKLWGRTFLPEGFIVWKAIPDLEKPLLFHYSLGAEYEDPYTSFEEPGDLWLVTGELQKNLFVRSHYVSPDKIAVVGQMRYSHLKEFKDKVPHTESLARLGIPAQYERYLLYDFQPIMRGLCNAHEIAETVGLLVSLATKNRTTAIIIKPHPSADVGLLAHLLGGRAATNIFVLDRAMLPYHALNCADMLITKASTLGIEAMMFGKPVLSVILDAGEPWKIYEEAVTYLYTVEELRSFLDRIVSDSDFFVAWRDAQIEKHQIFLRAYIHNSHDPASALAADAIIQCLKKRVSGSDGR